MALTVNDRDHLIQDHLIQEDVEEELAWAPQVKEARIGVSVLAGVVTLSGEVDTFIERTDAKDAALRVTGVAVVANEIEIRNASLRQRTDTDIAAAVQHVLGWSADLPLGAVQAEVRDHVVTLTGVVTWNHERKAATTLVHGLAGVLRVDNHIELTPRVSATNTAHLIRTALVRHALLDSHALTVTSVGSEVTLAGTVSTWSEKSDAADAAWSSPNVSAVHNKIEVRP